MKKSIKDFGIIVSSCDKYSDIWPIFFKLFKKYGNELTECSIYLNTESKKFSFEGLNIICPNDFSAFVPWGKRLRNCLDSVKEDYVLFLLDDFFIQKKANFNFINKCAKWLKSNKNVGCFNFIPIEPAIEKSKKYKKFCTMPVGMGYRFNAQAALWRKSVLFDSVLPEESPWDWETFGNLRNEYIMKNIEMYALDFNYKSPYDYSFVDYSKSTRDNIKVVSPIMRGKWVPSIVDKCFKENGIEIDYKKRGIFKEKKPLLIKRVFARLTRIFRTKKIMAERLAAREKYHELVEVPIREHLLSQNEKYNELVKEKIEK